MENIETIYQIIFNKTYNNEVLLDIELSKVTDDKLIVGMLCDLTKESYEADKGIMLSMLSKYKTDLDMDTILESNTYYIEKMKEFMSQKERYFNSDFSGKNPSLKTMEKFLDILISIKDEMIKDNSIKIEENLEFIEFIKSLEGDEKEFFKKWMLDNELYEGLTLLN
jgi:hypothetical protein